MNDTANLHRIKRLRYRANHRGIKEMDIILGQFANARLETLSEEMVDQFETLLNENDRDLLIWFTGENQFPLENLYEIFDLIRSHSESFYQNER